MTFGDAIAAAKKGSAIARHGWNGKGMFVYYVEGREIQAIQLRNEAFAHVGVRLPEDYPVKINGHFDMMAADGSIVVGWLASQTDMASEDWVIV